MSIFYTFEPRYNPSNEIASFGMGFEKYRVVKKESGFLRVYMESGDGGYATLWFMIRRTAFSEITEILLQGHSHRGNFNLSDICLVIHQMVDAQIEELSKGEEN